VLLSFSSSKSSMRRWLYGRHPGCSVTNSKHLLLLCLHAC
jgi:hypothetical protein